MSVLFDPTVPIMRRSLELHDEAGVLLRNVDIEVFAPIRGKDDWASWYEIRNLSELGSKYRFRGIQVDEFGAVLDAVHLLSAKLLSTEAYLGGRLYWFEPFDSCGLLPPIDLRNSI